MVGNGLAAASMSCLPSELADDLQTKRHLMAARAGWTAQAGINVQSKSRSLCAVLGFAACSRGGGSVVTSQFPKYDRFSKSS